MRASSLQAHQRGFERVVDYGAECPKYHTDSNGTKWTLLKNYDTYGLYQKANGIKTCFTKHELGLHKEIYIFDHVIRGND